MNIWPVKYVSAREFIKLYPDPKPATISSPTKKPKPKRGIRERCDALWSQCVKARANHRCQVEGCARHATDAHHVISRRCASLRVDLRNGVALCREHHNHSSSKMLERGIEIIGFEAYQELCATGKDLRLLRSADLEAIAKSLRDELKRLKKEL